MSITDEVKKLAKELGNSLTAEQMVAAAKDAAKWAKLHEHFWAPNLETLAHEARLARAHRLLIRIEVTTAEGAPVRQLVHIRGTPGYQPVETVISQPDLAAAKIAQLQEDIKRTRGRLAAFAALLPGAVVQRIDTHLAKAEREAELPKSRAKPRSKAA